MDTVLFVNYFFETIPLTFISFLLVNESLKRKYKTRLAILPILVAFVSLNVISTIIVHVFLYGNDFKILFGTLFTICTTFVVMTFMYQAKLEKNNIDINPQFTDLNNSKAIIECPNCQKKYSVPVGKYLEINCKSCHHEWKIHT
jgi:hypothetical protein